MVSKRAYDADAKAERRYELLDAAERLFAFSDGSLPSVAEIAHAAKVAKGTVYLYFASKEELFSALLLDDWAWVLDGLDHVLADHASVGADRILPALVDLLVQRPSVLRLDNLGAALTVGLSDEARQASRLALIERFGETGVLLGGRLGLAEGAGTRLLLRTRAFACGLWQAHMADIERGARELPPAFARDLLDALAEYWLGALQD